jgi:hypothetical protein
MGLLYLSACIAGSILVKVEGKEVPVLYWTGLEGCRRLMFPDFKTITL